MFISNRTVVFYVDFNRLGVPCRSTVGDGIFIVGTVIAIRASLLSLHDSGVGLEPTYVELHLNSITSTDNYL